MLDGLMLCMKAKSKVQLPDKVLYFCLHCSCVALSAIQKNRQ